MVQRRKLDLVSAELTTLVYVALTTVMIAIFWTRLDNPLEMLGLRGIALLIMVVTHFTYRFLPYKLSLAWRSFPLFALLIWWYPDIHYFCSLFPYQDHVFAAIDQTLFGCQPALEFDQKFDSAFWSELFNMGYYSYYYLMFSVIIFYLLCRTREYDKAIFIFLGSFFLFYIFYDFVPVAGPQYYFSALDNLYGDAGWGDSFPALGDYFKDHFEMIVPEVKGVFGQLVVGAQEMGERPAAAFPSSHVGMSTVSMLLAWRTGNKWLFWILMPFYVILCCSTVYIKAHYLIDSISGLIFAAGFYYITYRIYESYCRR